MTTRIEEDQAIRDHLEDAFAGRGTVRLGEAAGLLRMTDKTLRRHVAEGNIAFRSTGTGTVRMRREFALSDLLGFYEGRRSVEVPAAPVRGRPVMRAGSGMTGFLASVGTGTAKRSSRSARGGI